MKKFQATVNVGKEIAEIAKDFERPVEVLREALHNSYDATAKNVYVIARGETLTTGNRGLTLNFQDDGDGMNSDALKNFFGLGHSDKQNLTDRPRIGFKGHGTKIYYQAMYLWVATRSKENGELLVAHFPNARVKVLNGEIPEVSMASGDEAARQIKQHDLTDPGTHGTTIKLVDFTANSDRLIDVFTQPIIENYLRWFTIFGSFKHIVDNKDRTKAPLRLYFQGTDRESPEEITFGHAWPETDLVALKSLKPKDDRRPFNYFRKTFRGPNLATSGGFAYCKSRFCRKFFR